MHPLIKIPIRSVYIVSAAYLALPLAIWSFGWLRAPYSMIIAVALLLAVCLVIKSSKPNLFCGSDIVLRKRHLVIVIIVVMLWCLLGGQGGLFFQAEDWDARNAIFRDLITHEWPVIYSDGSALCYYFGFWLVPSLVGKVLVLLGLNSTLVWGISSIALLLWSCLGVVLCLLIFFSILKKVDSRALCIAVAMFFFFSGMDIVGLFLSCSDLRILELLFESMHIEWWASAYQFSSMTTQLFWVFNQAIPAWLITLLILATRTTKNDIFFGVLGAFLCPLPTIGLLSIGIAKLITEGKREGLVNAVKPLFSIQNLLAFVLLIPVVMFLFSNSRASTAPLPDASQIPIGPTGLFNIYIGGFTVHNFVVLLLFCLLEYGIYLLLLFPSERKNPYWWAVLITLLIVNVVRMGPSADFPMRASIPSLVLLLVLLAKHLVNRDFVSYRSWFKSSRGNHVERKTITKGRRFVTTTLVLCLIIGGITPLVEIGRVPVKMISYHEFPMPFDATKTFEGASTANFNLMNYEQTRFCRYVGKL